MNAGNTKPKWTTVRLLQKVKNRLQRIARRRGDLEERYVAECELANIAVIQYCRKEEKKLGILNTEEVQL